MTEITPIEEPKSKTQKKREMHALQELGEALVALSAEQLAKFGLEDILLDAILDAQRMPSHGAKRRQLQYIGKLMRSVDPEPIAAMLEQIHQKGRAETARFHALERWRERLIEEGDTALNDLLTAYPEVDRQYLRQLIRNAQQERKKQQTQRYARLLFQYLKKVS